MGHDSRKLPVPYSAPKGGADIDHHLKEWSSGEQGGGTVPKDFEWRSNPKQNQEEDGANDKLD